MWFRDLDSEGRELTRECQAFLDGRFVEYVVDRDDDVPVWAWTNMLAHGTHEDLLAPAVHLPVEWEDYLRPWLEARAYLAGEVLVAADRSGPLTRVQRTALVPLELRLARDPQAWNVRASDWVTMVLNTLAPLTSWKSVRSR